MEWLRLVIKSFIYSSILYRENSVEEGNVYKSFTKLFFTLGSRSQCFLNLKKILR